MHFLQNSNGLISGYDIMRSFNSQIYCMEAKIMERTSNQPTFLDSSTSDLGGRRTAVFSTNAIR